MTLNEKISIVTGLLVVAAMAAFMTAGVVLHFAGFENAAMRGALAAMIVGGTYMATRVAFALAYALRKETN